MAKELNRKFFDSIFWTTISQLGYVLLALAGNVILAHFLTAEDFGLIGVSMFFIGVSNVLVEGGVGGALVRKKTVTEEDYSTVFIFNLLISIVLFVFIFVIAKSVALYYGNPDIKEVLRTLSFLIIINAFIVVQNTKLIREMNFKKIGIYRFFSLAVATLVACYLAYSGLGVWAIVSMQIISAFLFMSVLWLKFGGINRLVFSKKTFKEVFSFGVFTTLSSILNIAFDNIYQLVIGRYFSLSQVGYYYQAKKLFQAPDGIFRSVILQVFYSYLSKFNDNTKVFVVKFNLIAKSTAIILGLLIALIYIYAEQIISILYGNKWIESVFFLRLISLAGYFVLLDMINRNVFKISNQTNKIFYLEIFNKIIQIISISIGVYFLDLNYLLYGFIATSVISYLVNLYYSMSIIGNLHSSLFLDISKITFSSGLSVFVFIELYEYINLDLYTRILLIPIFIGLYLVTLTLMRILDKGFVINLKEVLNVK